ncbi:MAG: citramalate synthase, partial [Clostridia bacterium]|nr:citramalate synthase [Clostridia bacterium]
RLKRMPAFFEVKDFKVISDTGQISSALIKISVDGREEMTAAEGNGPVDALDRALRKALMVFYPCLIDLELDDFKVRVIETGQGTSAKVRVTMESTNGKVRWGTVGVSVNILDASWQALVDSIECQLMYTRGI